MRLHKRLAAPFALCFALLVLACGGGGSGGFDGDPDATSYPVEEASFEHNLAALNAVRTARGLPLFVRSAALDDFAETAVNDYRQTRVAHRYFHSFTFAELEAHGFSGHAAENQGRAPGVAPSVAGVNGGIDVLMNLFMSEESLPAGHPDRGHFEHIVDPNSTVVGIGLVRADDGNLFLTNEFSAN